ncbi:MAG: exopolysaccharide biosynthesis polyprenyl glycosylphosphotransferase [Flavobacteriaceae bacterium]|nr:exopolysaccharide biosynthesis polyprenyl glycosylphosphotransferase [Flavobacteriaceae bacterium]
MRRIDFEISERKVLLRILDVVFVLSGLHLVGSYFELEYFTLTKESWYWAVVLAVYITLIGTVFELYDLQSSSRWDSTFKNVVLTASVTVLFYLLTPVLTPFLPVKRIEIVYFYLIIVMGIFLWRILYMTLLSSPRFYKRVLVIGEIEHVKSMIETLRVIDPNYDIFGFINTDKTSYGDIADLKEFQADQIKAVISENKINETVVATYNDEAITPKLYQNLISLIEQGHLIREYSQVYEAIVHRIPVQFVGKDFYRYFPFSRSNKNQLYQIFSRTLDIVVSVIGLIFMVILIPFVLLGNLIGNKGPLFYTQERVGKNGRPFKIIKFRTMVTHAEADGAKWAEANDSRVTPFGRFLRNSRIDELPQFLNVIKGQMALIGPRPERPIFVKELSEVIPFYETRHVIKPGLTGWAQVKMRYGSSVDDSLIKLQYDLFYIKRRSFFLDVNVIFKTISTILYYRGQ